LTELDWSVLNRETLTELYLYNNNFHQQDLSFFTNFINLRELSLGTTEQVRISDGLINRWTGSLEHLKNLTKLVILYIGNTNLDSGLEYLPVSLERIYCEGTRLAEELKDYKQGNYYNYQA
jgi:hypothetical protein